MEKAAGIFGKGVSPAAGKCVDLAQPVRQLLCLVFTFEDRIAKGSAVEVWDELAVDARYPDVTIHREPCATVRIEVAAAMIIYLQGWKQWPVEMITKFCQDRVDL